MDPNWRRAVRKKQIQTIFDFAGQIGGAEKRSGEKLCHPAKDIEEEVQEHSQSAQTLKNNGEEFLGSQAYRNLTSSYKFYNTQYILDHFAVILRIYIKRL